MKYLAIILFALSTAVSADPRLNTNENFCHFVTPEGFANGNDDDEEFVQGCNGGTIRQNDDGTGNGSILITVKRPNESMAFIGDYEFSGAESGFTCVMVDSNGTTYATQDWDAIYVGREGREHKQKGKGHDKHKYKHLLKSAATATYQLVCRNGAQQ